MTNRSLFACAALAALVSLSAVPAQAESWPGCQAKIDRAVTRLDRATDRYGRHSGQADRERFKVREIVNKCHDQFGRWYGPRWARGSSEY